MGVLRFIKRILAKLSLIKAKATDYVAFIRYVPSHSDRKKQVYVGIENPQEFERYYYTLLKFLDIQGYEVHVPNKFRVFTNIKNKDRYMNLLLEEGIPRFSSPSDNQWVIKNEQVNVNYFTVYGSTPTDSRYYIPISQHPLMYRRNLWNESIYDSGRKNSLFFAGNFERVKYQKIENNVKLNVSGRIAIYDYLKVKGLLKCVSTLKSLKEYIESDAIQDCVIVDRDHFDIPMEELRLTLSKFRYFLAAPGVTMPLCHNIIEAMSVGTIPIIQKDYALLFAPPLEHRINAMVFEELEDLGTIIHDAYRLTEEDAKSMKDAVIEYYNNFFTPKAVVKRLAARPDTLFLLTERKSIEMFEEREMT